MSGSARRFIHFAFAIGGLHDASAQSVGDTTNVVRWPPSDTAQTPTPSSPIVGSSLYGALSASYATSNNWVGQNQRTYALVGNLIYMHTAISGGRGHTHQVLADLGYLKFVDSTWAKNLDRLQTNFLWNSTGKRFNQSWSVAFGTQFLPNTVAVYDSIQDRVVQRSAGGIMNPFSLQLGYGAVFSFWGGSNINFAFATLQLSNAPKLGTPPVFLEATFAESRRSYYFMSYGFSIAAAINRSFGERVQWINNTRVFGNGVDRNHVNLDFANMVVVKLWKYVQLRFDTRLAYNPLLNYKMQFRQEALVGFFYERKR